MWFVLQVFLSCCLVLASVLGSWFVVWKLILSKFAFFQEILGIRPSLAQITAGVSGKPGSIQTAEQAAALKKRKQRENNTFVLTRSGEQMAQTQRRQSMRNAALAQQQGLGGRTPGMPTSTPLDQSMQLSATPAPLIPASASSAHPSWVADFRTPGSATPTGGGGAFIAATSTPAAAALPSGTATPALLQQQRAHTRSQPPQQQPQPQHGRVGSFTPGTAGSASAAVLGTPLSQLHPSAVPTSNLGAAALAAEALLRRQQQAMFDSPPAIAAAGTQPPNAAQTAPAAAAAQPAQSAAAQQPPPTTIGGAGWLKRAAIIENYEPNSS